MTDFLHFLEFGAGPAFLLFYAIWFAVIFVVVIIARVAGGDSAWTTGLALLVFDGMGLYRIYLGLQHDMHRWIFLIIMMIVGTLLLSIRLNTSRHETPKSWRERRRAAARSSAASSDSGGSSCSSGGSSCGSSCGGGGGCGGCGGGG